MKKKQIFLAALFCLLATANQVNADNYFTLGTDNVTAVNDTLRIHPIMADYYLQMYAVVHSEGYFDHWYLEMTHPDSLFLDLVDNSPNPANNTPKEGPSMNVPYVNSTGDSATYQAVFLNKVLNVHETGTDTDTLKSYFSSTITQPGYWDPNNTGNYQTYGNVKWGSGTHDYMFEFKINIPYGTIHTDITLATTLTSTDDSRDIETVNVIGAEKTIHIWIAFKQGDVTGDGYVNLGDVTQLVDWINNGFPGANIYQQAACDVNGDGHVSMADITYLIDVILELHGTDGLIDELINELQ